MSKKKIRAEFRKTHQGRRRKGDLTRDFARDEVAEDRQVREERISGKGNLTRKRTVVGTATDPDAAGVGVLRDVDRCLIPARAAHDTGR